MADLQTTASGKTGLPWGYLFQAGGRARPSGFRILFFQSVSGPELEYERFANVARVHHHLCDHIPVLVILALFGFAFPE